MIDVIHHLWLGYCFIDYHTQYHSHRSYIKRKTIFHSSPLSFSFSLSSVRYVCQKWITLHTAARLLHLCACQSVRTGDCVCVCIFKCTTKYAAKYNKQLRGLVTFRIWMCFSTQHTLRQNTGSRTYTATNLIGLYVIL